MPQTATLWTQLKSSCKRSAMHTYDIDSVGVDLALLRILMTDINIHIHILVEYYTPAANEEELGLVHH